MDNVKIFENKEFGQIRTVLIDNESWFVGKDIAMALGYKDTSDALKRHIDKDDKLSRGFTDSGQTRNMYIINESGLYSLILSSKLESAKKFKRWITSDVLPSIRKNGMYATDELLDNPELMIKIVTKLKEEREERKRLELINKQNEHKVLFADSVISSNDSVSVGTLAKLICQNGYEIGQNRLFDWLRENDYLMKNGERKNQPRQEYIERGFFTVSEKCFTDTYGNTRLGIQTRITPRGQLYFINKFLGKENNLYAEVCSIGS